jgi:hypothetical protein
MCGVFVCGGAGAGVHPAAVPVARHRRLLLHPLADGPARPACAVLLFKPAGEGPAVWAGGAEAAGLDG